MHFTSLLSVLAFGSALVVASPLTPEARGGPDTVLNAGNCYGAPLPPWEHGAYPGWYFGDRPGGYHGIVHLYRGICKHVKHFPHALRCPPTRPPPSDGYKKTFSNLSGATQAKDYLTFGLVDTVKDCKAMCNSVAGCNFVNTYHDVNGKNGSPLLTCALFKNCHTAADATNTGGQTQPNGSINYITDSDGWCKKW